MTETTSGRRFGVALIGLFVGFGLHKALGVAVIALVGGSLPATVASGLLLEVLLPGFAIAGVLLALWLDTKRRHVGGGHR